MQEADRLGKKLYLYAGPQPQHKANAAVLVSTQNTRRCCMQRQPQQQAEEADDEWGG
jgi:hypothetical protein